METDKVKQRLAFVLAYETGQWSMTELCERFGITRPTGYLVLERYQVEGEVGLQDRPRCPLLPAHRTNPIIEAQVIATRKTYGWGAKKLLQVLSKRYPDTVWPARSTVNDILERHGLLRKNRRRRRWQHPGAASLVTDHPNQVWPADFKGQFKTRDARYCHPLTVSDHFSRMLLECRGLPSVETVGAKPAFERLFHELGLPEAIRTDNGVPFASTGIHGLCELNVWWMQLGIVHQRIRPASPQENGQHERMHQDLKRETTRPPAENLRAQQHVFDKFRHRYNYERPHDGIGGALPSELYRPSDRPMPERIEPPDYPGHLEVRRVSSCGTFRLRSGQIFLSNALANEYIGLEEVADGIWNIIYYKTLLGRFDDLDGKITGNVTVKEPSGLS
jgi:putative transposase